MRFVSVVRQRRIRQEFAQPFGIDARAFRQQLRGQLLLDVLILLHPHQDRRLSRDELVTSHAVVLLDDPPAFLNVMPASPGLY